MHCLCGGLFFAAEQQQPDRSQLKLLQLGDDQKPLQMPVEQRSRRSRRSPLTILTDHGHNATTISQANRWRECIDKKRSLRDQLNKPRYWGTYNCLVSCSSLLWNNGRMKDCLRADLFQDCLQHLKDPFFRGTPNQLTIPKEQRSQMSSPNLGPLGLIGCS